MLDKFVQSPTTEHNNIPCATPSALQSEFQELRNCFADLSFTVARQDSHIRALQEELAVLKAQQSKEVGGISSQQNTANPYADCAATTGSRDSTYLSPSKSVDKNEVRERAQPYS